MAAITSFYVDAAPSGQTASVYLQAVWTPQIQGQETLYVLPRPPAPPVTTIVSEQVTGTPIQFPGLSSFIAASSTYPVRPAGGTTPTSTTTTSSSSTNLSPPTSRALSGSGTGTSFESPTTSPGTTTEFPVPQPPPTGQPQPRDNSGAIAGAAVGCLIAGLLIGFAVAFFLYRRRRQDAVRYDAATAEPKYAGASAPSSVEPQQDRLQLSQFLLDTIPDKDMAGELGALDQLIQNHVENHYHLQPIQANPAALAQALANLGLDDPGAVASVDAVVALALDPRTRFVALRHVVSYICFSSVDFSARSRLSMLPPPVAAFLRSVPPADHQRGNAQAASVALSRWRTLSAFLLHPQRAERTPLVASDHAVLPQAAGLANAMMSFLQPFVVPGGGQGQAEHLQAVILECTKLGYVLLSQPADWRFVHSAAVQPGLRFLVVCAGLVKVGDKDGQPYDAPRQVAAPLLVQV